VEQVGRVGSGGHRQPRKVFIQHHYTLSETVVTAVRISLEDKCDKTPVSYTGPLPHPPASHRSTRNEGVGGIHRLPATLAWNSPRTSNSADTTDVSIRNELHEKRGCRTRYHRRDPTQWFRVERIPSEHDSPDTPSFLLERRRLPSVSCGDGSFDTSTTSFRVRVRLPEHYRSVRGRGGVSCRLAVPLDSKHSGPEPDWSADASTRRHATRPLGPPLRPLLTHHRDHAGGRIASPRVASTGTVAHQPPTPEFEGGCADANCRL
jgi:hypothetical protein